VETLSLVLRQDVVNFEEVLGKKVSRKWRKIDPNALFWVDKMRRSVKTSLPWKPSSSAIGSQERINECTCAPFSFCSGDVNDIKTVDVGCLLQLESAHSRIWMS